MTFQSLMPGPDTSGEETVRGKIALILNDLNRRMTYGENFDAILNLAFDALGVIIPFDRIGVAVISGDPQTITQTWVKSHRPCEHLRIGYSARLDDHPNLRKIVETGTSRIICDLPSYLRDHPESTSTALAVKDGIKSSLTFPLRSHGKVSGLVFFSSYALKAYDDSHRSFFADVADEFSLVFQYKVLNELQSTRITQTQNIRSLLHDLRSPLAIIQGFTEVLCNEELRDSLDQKNKKIYEIIHKNSKFMASLINDMELIDQLETRRCRLTYSEIVLRDFLEDFLEHGQLLAEKKTISFEITVRPDLPRTLRADRVKLWQILENLLTNAIKYSWPHTHVRLEVAAEKERAVFRMIDEGQGIAKSELPNLFQEFGMTSTLTTGGEKSTGLGLFIVKKLVQAHQGDVGVESTLGVGSTFQFDLPLSPAMGQSSLGH